MCDPQLSGKASFFLAVFLLVAPTGSGEAWAEPASEPDLFVPLAPTGEEELTADDESVSTLDETVIQASKLDATLPQTGTSVGRVDADRIENHQLRDVNDAYRMMANVRAPQGPDGGFVIRGVNSESPDAENASGVQSQLSSIFVDGVALTQQGVRRGQTGVWDVASVEVLRGPQSTQQGRNTLAGAVHLRTLDPVFNWDGASRITWGNFNRKEVSAMLNVPVNQAVAMRFTAERAEEESFVNYPLMRNFPRFEDYRTSDTLQLRGKILVAPPHSPLSSKLTWSYVERSPFRTGVFGPNADRRVGSFEDFVWLSASPNQQVRDVQNHSLAWENTHEISDSMRATALTTYTRTLLGVTEIDGGSIREDLEQDLTQEVRVNWDDSWGRAVLGIYGSTLRAETTAGFERNRNNLALFGEADVPVLEDWFVIGGGRVSYEEFDFSAFAGGSDSEETVFLPKAGIRYELRPDHTLGFTVQRGYQSGGAGIDTDGADFSFDPSFTWHCELAYRNAFLGGKLNVAANAFYSNWKDQQVVLRTMNPTTFQISERVINAAGSSLYGAELEVDFQPIDTLQLFGSIGLLSTRYDDFKFGIDPTIASGLGVPSSFDYKGYDFPQSPELNVSLGFQWTHQSGFFVAADAAYNSSYFSPVLFAPLGSGVGGISVQVPQDEVVEIDPLLTVNLTAGLESGNWKFTVFIANLFDERYLIGKSPGARQTPSGLTFIDDFLASAGAPRTYGTALEFRF